MRHYVRTDLLTGNALLRTRLLTRSGPDAATPRALKDLIAETAETCVKHGGTIYLTAADAFVWRAGFPQMSFQFVERALHP